MDQLQKRWRRYKFKNLTLTAVGIGVAVWLARQQGFLEFMAHVGQGGTTAAFIGGMLFVTTVTVPAGVVLLFNVAHTLHVIDIAVIAGLGAVVGDLTIFRLVKNNLAGELKLLLTPELKNRHLQHLIRSKYFSWTLPVLGAIIIASPLPDEIGVSLMGISKMSVVKFTLISFVLNTLGIFLIVTAGAVLG